jgi:hypothetical protein
LTKLTTRENMDAFGDDADFTAVPSAGEIFPE